MDKDEGPSPISGEADPSRGEQKSKSAGANQRAAASSSRDGRADAPSGGPVRQDRAAQTTFTLDGLIRFLLGAAAVAASTWLLWYFAGIVLYLVVGAVLAYLLRPLVNRVQAMGLGRVPAILVAFVFVVGVISVVVTSFVPFVAQQVRDLSQLITVDTAAYVARYLERQIQVILPIEPGALEQNVRDLSKSLMQGDLVRGEQVADTVGSVVAVFTNIIYAVVIIPFVTFFLLKDELEIRRSLLHLVPNRYFEVTVAILTKVEANIGRYFRALLVQCTFIALIASILLWIVGLRGAIAIGIFTGLANTIPYFGPVLGFLGGTLVGIAQTGDMALVPGIAIAMGLTQLADNVLLQPLIFSRAAQTHPLVILFVVLAGAKLGGILGMLVAIPLTTTVRVIVEQLLWSLRNYRILRAG